MDKVQKSGNLTYSMPYINVRTLYNIPVFRIQFVHLRQERLNLHCRIFKRQIC